MIFKLFFLFYLAFSKASSPKTSCIIGKGGVCQTFKRGFDPLIISGPSGSGKSVVIPKILQSFVDKFRFSISHTTRPKRFLEKENRDYFFVKKEEFKSMIENAEFLEHDINFQNNYGTTITQILQIQAEGKIPVLDISIRGAIKLKGLKVFSDPLFIFIMPRDLSILHSTLTKRGTEDAEMIKLRLEEAAREIDLAKKCGIYLEGDNMVKSSNFDELARNIIKKLHHHLNP